jgi:hypothetical protein
MAKLWTNKSISGAITITTGTNDTLTFDINGTSYTVTVPSNTYNSSHFTNTSELVDAIQSSITAQSIPITARVGGVYSSSSRYCVLAFEGTNLPVNIAGNMATLFN